MARNRSRYLWTAMKEVSRKPAAATRRMKAWESGGGWRSARAADDWRQCSSANRRSRRMASSGANFRWRARTRALRELRVSIWGSPRGVYLTVGEPKFLDFLSFPLISGHFRPGGGFPGRAGVGLFHARVWSQGLGRSKCQGAFHAEGAERAQRARRLRFKHRDRRDHREEIKKLCDLCVISAPSALKMPHAPNPRGRGEFPTIE